MSYTQFIIKFTYINNVNWVPEKIYSWNKIHKIKIKKRKKFPIIINSFKLIFYHKIDLISEIIKYFIKMKLSEKKMKNIYFSCVESLICDIMDIKYG